MTDGKLVGRDRDSERSLETKEREAREHDERVQERDEYNLPFTD